MKEGHIKYPCSAGYISLKDSEGGQLLTLRLRGALHVSTQTDHVLPFQSFHTCGHLPTSLLLEPFRASLASLSGFTTSPFYHCTDRIMALNAHVGRSDGVEKVQVQIPLWKTSTPPLKGCTWLCGLQTVLKLEQFKVHGSLLTALLKELVK